MTGISYYCTLIYIQPTHLIRLTLRVGSSAALQHCITVNRTCSRRMRVPTHSLVGLRAVAHFTIRSTLSHYHLSCVIVRYLESELNVCRVFADEDDDNRAGAQCLVMAGRTTRVVNALVSQELVESENCTITWTNLSANNYDYPNMVRSCMLVECCK